MLDLARVDPATVRRRWSVVLERTVRELQGQCCISLEDEPASKKEIAYTLSFGHPVTELHDLGQAVTVFASGGGQVAAAAGPGSKDQRVYSHQSLPA